MILPFLISVPHAGIQVPPEINELNQLGPEHIIEDGDQGAREIYDIRNDVTAFVTTQIARAFIDVNRAETDLSPDGIVKTETIYKIPVYKKPLTQEQINDLIKRYYQPYHQKLTELAPGVILGIDCHTMAAQAPPICPDAGRERPLICLSNDDRTCSREWLHLMADCLADSFQCRVRLNEPFRGGFIIKSHASELPWLQLELSRHDFLSRQEKKLKILTAFKNWWSQIGAAK